MSFLVSIIIPTYNRANIIEQTLDSILMQTYTNWECIIVDDGSIDNSLEIISNYVKKDKRFSYHNRPENHKKGANGCRNYGFELSKGQFVKWFDSDDILLSNALEVSSFYFSKNIELIVCSLEYIDYERKLINKQHKYYSEKLLEDYLIGNISFYTFIPTWNRNFLLKQKYLFDENLGNMDDWDFNLRMLYQNPNIQFIHEILIQYRLHENSLSQEIDKLDFDEIKSEFRAIEKHLSLLKSNKIIDWKILHQYSIDRYRYILRSALVKNDNAKYYYLKQLLIKQYQFYQFKEILKSALAFCFYTIFKKGYKYL